MGSHPERADRRLWILNLDAEQELAALAKRRSLGRRDLESIRPQPTDATRARVRRWAPLAAQRLVGGDDLVCIDGELFDASGERRSPDEAAGRTAHAWSPTPGARWTAESVGATLAPSPPLESILAANARPFTAALAQEESVQVRKALAPDLETARALLARPAPNGWLARGPYGMAGSARKRLHPGRPSDPERHWLTRQLQLGPLVIEPWVEIVAETTRCAWLRPDGSLSIAAPGFQSVDRFGQWQTTDAAAPSEIHSTDDQRLLAALERAGRALRDVGYWGPFGIDAFWHRDLETSARAVLQPLSEINARYTMDWNRATADEVG
ncbi:MAG: hypothetical protein AAFZ65_04045 [Planctomycetota bacterium]